MVDVQEQSLGRRHSNGRTIKRNLLRSLDGHFVTLVDGSGESCGMLRYESTGVSQGFYFGGRQVCVSKVRRVYSDQRRIELYSSQPGVIA